MTPRRYIDWFITTPTMLISTIIFMEYRKNKEQGLEKIEETNVTQEEVSNWVKEISKGDKSKAQEMLIDINNKLGFKEESS